MQLTWLGNSAFKLVDKEVTVVVNPYDGMAKTQADIVLHSSADAKSGMDSIKGEPFVISTPGEYEVKNVFVYGVPGYKKEDGKKKEQTTMFLIETDGITVAHLGEIGQDQLTEEQLELLEGADILLVPIQGEITVEKAVNITNRIEPRIVIPMQYKSSASFVDEIGLKPETMEKLKIVKKELPQEDMKLIILEAEK